MTTTRKPQQMRPRLVRLDDLELAPDDENARVHGPITDLEQSLERWDQVLPVVIRTDGRIVGGNRTVKAARAAGFSHLYAVTFDGTDDEAAALAVALNRLAEQSRADGEHLPALLERVRRAGLEGTGYSTADVDRLLERARGRDDSGAASRPTGRVRKVITCPKCGHEFTGQGAAASDQP